MSNGDINRFLDDLCKSEGGANPKAINTFGYIGKYQFGEDSLIDLGYYKKADGESSRDANGNFRFQWTGTWTGKNGVISRSAFLDDVQKQDQAGREWVKLLCSRAKKFKLHQYIGQHIGGIEITESGIIAAAHLRGFGSSKSPGVRQFLMSNGEIDPRDANGTPVSKYMRIFADYDLNCCGSVAAVLIDKDKKPISGIPYQIQKNGKVATQGKTDKNGATKKVQGLDAGSSITVLIQKVEGGFKEIAAFVAQEVALIATLHSPKRVVATKLEAHTGALGSYQKHNPKKKSNPTAASPASGSSSTARSVAPPQRPQVVSPTNNDTSSLTEENSVTSPASSDTNQITLSETATVPPVSESQKNNPNGDGDGVPLSEQPLPVEIQRNGDGHPVAVVKLNASLMTVTPSIQKLEEILMRNVAYGSKTEILSGLVAVEKSKTGEPISATSKEINVSLGRCYKYVKIALLASGMVKKYLGQEAAKDAGIELQKEGFHNLLDNPNHGLQSPYDAPVGAVIVYDVTDGSRWGHIEVRTSKGFASDYFSERPRTVSFGKEANASMFGRNRKVIGIWEKD